MFDSWSDFISQFIGTFVTGNRWKMFTNGLLVSLEITLGALVIGVILGVVVAVVRTAHDQSTGKKNAVISVLNAICKIYTTVIRGTPLMVQLMIMAFIVFASSRNQTGVAILAFGINSGAYTAEIIRSGIMSIDPGQMEAGRSLGLGYGTVMKEIVIPQAFKNILPALGNELITLFKDTSLVTVIGGIYDLTYAAKTVSSITYRVFMPYIGIALMYLVVVMILTWLQGKLERRLRKSDRK